MRRQTPLWLQWYTSITWSHNTTVPVAKSHDLILNEPVTSQKELVDVWQYKDVSHKLMTIDCELEIGIPKNGKVHTVGC